MVRYLVQMRTMTVRLVAAPAVCSSRRRVAFHRAGRRNDCLAVVSRQRAVDVGAYKGRG